MSTAPTGFSTSPGTSLHGSTTRRATVWQSPTVRRGAIDVLAIGVLLVVGALSFGPTFLDAKGYVAALGGAAIGLTLGVLATWRRWSRLGTLLAGMIAYLAFGGALALPSTTIGGVLPQLSTLRRLTLLSWQSWRDLLTVAVPAGEFDGPAVLPYVVGVLTASLATLAALRMRRTGWVLAGVLLPTASFLLIGILWGTSQAPLASVQGLLFTAVGLAWASWRSQLGTPDQHAVFRAAPTDRAPKARRAVSAAIALALTGGVGVGAWALLSPDPHRAVLRNDVQPPLDLSAYPTPLAKFRQYETAPMRTARLFEVTGLPAGARIRLAAMDVYDGNVYRVSDQSAQFARVGHSITAGAFATDLPTQRLTFRIDKYDDVWLPGGGDLRSQTFTGTGADTTRADVYYNAATGTAVVPSHVRSGLSYTLDVGLAPHFTVAQLAALADDAAPDDTFPMPTTTTIPPFVPTAMANLKGAAESPMDEVRALAAGMRGKGFFADGGVTPSLPGHTIGRLAQLLGQDPTQVDAGDSVSDQKPMIGDDEQYAVAMALMARSLDLPARVVMGFYPDPKAPVTTTTPITGHDAHVWVEVRFDRYGWVPFDPTPDRNKKPEQNTPQPKPQNEPQVLPPPDPPQDHDAPPLKPAKSATKKTDRSVVLAVLGYVAATVGVLALLAAPFVAIAVLKARRRRRRRTSGRLADRISGGWAELVDLGADAGVRVPTHATRYETANLLGTTVPTGTGVAIATRIDGHVFGVPDPTDGDVDGVWAAVEVAEREFRESASLRTRLRTRFSVRSLLRQPQWIARLAGRGRPGGGT